MDIRGLSQKFVDTRCFHLIFNVNMQDKYVNMQAIYVNMQLIYGNMQGKN